MRNYNTAINKDFFFAKKHRKIEQINANSFRNQHLRIKYEKINSNSNNNVCNDL